MSQYDINVENTDRYSLRGKVFHRLREDILAGKYKEHEELREMAISEEMGVSRTPVREALRQLELEGLVTIIPNKGAYVTGITRKDVEDIYAIRALLEGLCAKWATLHISQQQLERLEEVIFLSEFHASKNHAKQLTELDDQFHDILYEACNSKMLEHQLKDFHEYVRRVRKTTFSDNTRSLESVKEHRQIMEAIREKDGDRAEQLATLHMKNAYANMLLNGLSKTYDGNGSDMPK
ncbi:MAG: GntR family transcriptional regulator [Lachnospiraceae bacterium]|nr:GntR family transcriptional regulator [Lachnospiraceae bacterium]